MDRTSETFSPISQPGIATSLNKQNRPAADMAIMQFIVGLGLSASIVEKPYFRVMVTALRDAGPNYLPPKRHAFDLDSYSCSEVGVQANPLHLGKVLFSELQRIRKCWIKLETHCAMMGQSGASNRSLFNFDVSTRRLFRTTDPYDRKI